MARPPIVTRADVEKSCPTVIVDAGFVPTHRVSVTDPHAKFQVLRTDLVRLEEADPGVGVAYAYGPDGMEPLYGVLSTGLWQSLETHGRVNATPVRYEARYVSLKDREGCVYFVEAGSSGPIKIGWTQDVERRIAELQTANARKLRLLGTVPGTMELESALHVRFSHLRLEAEWFKNGSEILSFIKKEAVKSLYEAPSK